eukprot:scaffold144533_cov53-Attheya_sp.AAC.2
MARRVIAESLFRSYWYFHRVVPAWPRELTEGFLPIPTINERVCLMRTVSEDLIFDSWVGQLTMISVIVANIERRRAGG